MNRYTGAAIFFGAAIGLTSIGVAVTGGIADAHQANASILDAHCLDNNAWGATMSISSDVPGGTATILGATNGKVAVPYTHLYTTMSDQAFMAFTVTVSWPDGFTSPEQGLRIDRPADGCGAPPSTTTSTTTCEQANPPRDCGGTTTVPTYVPPTTIWSTTPATTVAPPVVDSTPPIIHTTDGPTTTVGATPNKVQQALPVTGSNTVEGATVAAVFMLAGAAAIVATRRKAA